MLSHLIIFCPAPLWRHGQWTGAQQAPVAPIGLAKDRLHPVHTRLEEKKHRVRHNSSMETSSRGLCETVTLQQLLLKFCSTSPEACPKQDSARIQTRRFCRNTATFRLDGRKREKFITKTENKEGLACFLLKVESGEVCFYMSLPQNCQCGRLKEQQDRK